MGVKAINPSIQSMRNQPVEVQRMQTAMPNNGSRTTTASSNQRPNAQNASNAPNGKDDKKKDRDCTIF